MHQRNLVKITHSPLRVPSHDLNDRGLLSHERTILDRIEEVNGEVTEFTATLASNHQQTEYPIEKNEGRRNNQNIMTFNPADKMESRYGR